MLYLSWNWDLILIFFKLTLESERNTNMEYGCLVPAALCLVHFCTQSSWHMFTTEVTQQKFDK